MAETKTNIQPSLKSGEGTYFISYFSIIMIVISGTILSFLLYRASERVRSDDKPPELMSLTPDLIAKLGGSPECG